MTEMTASVIAFKYDGGKLEELQTLPTAEMNPSVSGAEIAVHPSGKFVYSSTRGANLIDGFAIDTAKGTLRRSNALLRAVRRRATSQSTRRARFSWPPIRIPITWWSSVSMPRRAN